MQNISYDDLLCFKHDLLTFDKFIEQEMQSSLYDYSYKMTPNYLKYKDYETKFNICVNPFTDRKIVCDGRIYKKVYINMKILEHRYNIKHVERYAQDIYRRYLLCEKNALIRSKKSNMRYNDEIYLFGEKYKCTVMYSIKSRYKKGMCWSSWIQCNICLGNNTSYEYIACECNSCENWSCNTHDGTYSNIYCNDCEKKLVNGTK